MTDPSQSVPPPDYVKGHDLLAGKSVVITAAGAGIGYAAARRCLEEGARGILISDIHEGRLMQARERLAGLGHSTEVHARICNVADEEHVQGLMDEAEAQFGTIDVVINNAGMGAVSQLVEMSDEEWSSVLDVTLTGTFRMTRAALKKMIPNKQGAIVNNGSVLGWRAQKGQSHYAAAKAGVMAFTRCSALEAAEHGIRINAVSPTIVLHEFLRKSAPQDYLEELAAKEAFGRAAEAWEIANIMVFLASDYSSYLVGEIISASNQHP